MGQQLPQSTDTTAPRPLILVVDDVPENRFIVQRRLDRMGYDCILAANGPDALNMIRAMSPSLVLLDFMMPDMDGLTVLRELRASPAYSGLPIIMLTARTDGESVASALDEGADDYVLKPIDFTALKARVDASLLRRELALSLADANSKLDARAAAQAIELGTVRELLHDTFQRVHSLEQQALQQDPE
jgi:DNA-binding response OmpR family regulator